MTEEEQVLADEALSVRAQSLAPGEEDPPQGYYRDADGRRFRFYRPYPVYQFFTVWWHPDGVRSDLVPSPVVRRYYRLPDILESACCNVKGRDLRFCDKPAVAWRLGRHGGRRYTVCEDHKRPGDEEPRWPEAASGPPWHPPEGGADAPSHE